VFSQQCGLACHCRSIHVCLHPNSHSQSMSDGLDYEIADNISLFDDDTQIQRSQKEIFRNAGTPIDDKVWVQSFQYDNWDCPAPFATPQQSQLCHSLLDTNLGKTKLNNILKWRVIVPNTNNENLDQLYNLIACMKKINGLGCRWEERSISIERNATPFCYWKPITVVGCIVGH